MAVLAGAFSDPVRRAAARRGTSVEGAAEQLKEQLVLHPGQQQPLSHTAGFEVRGWAFITSPGVNMVLLQLPTA
jgi:hypothetical protein